MPIAEPTSIDLRQYSLRHVGPKATIFPDTPGASFTVLSRTDMVARPLPQANIPTSPDFVQGSWTGRLFDAGDGKLVFPNKEASDGTPWRMRFDPTGKLQWCELWLDGYLDTVLCVTKVTPDRASVTVEGYDGLQMTKSAYQRDWTCIQAPRDVIERGTQLWTSPISDTFPAGSLNAQWTNTSSGGGTATIGPSGNLNLTVPAINGAFGSVDSAAIAVSATGAWSVQCDVVWTGLDFFFMLVQESSGDLYSVELESGPIQATLQSPSGAVSQVPITPTPGSLSLLLESDGEWVSGYVNGQLIGTVRRTHATTTSLKTRLAHQGLTATSANTAVVSSVCTKALQPFLQRGADKGDYVLPGSASTYPIGGLHARYSNNLDLQTDLNRLLKIHSPLRMQAYAGSGSQEYQNQQDAQINGQANPTPGAATTGWSCIWFGAIYLRPDLGTTSIELALPNVTGNAVRVWIGKTQFGDQGIDQWSFGTVAQFPVYNITAASLAGTLPYEGGTVAQAGWYPIKVEYAVDSAVRVAPQLIFFPPANYTDPGGTALSAGVQTTVPSTSLSPLGMVDQRFQGTSHYDLIQKTALGFGYQYSLEPQQLESGLFPGVVAPRAREGTDYDAILEPDDNARREGIINYSSLVDGTDQVSSIIGNGAGFQNGTTGQLQATVFDPPTLQASLFDMQGWQDFADASFPSLLEALLQGQMALRLVPWSVVSGDPMGRHRQAFTWPLPGSVQNFRWRPGDGVRILARDINVQDTSPRQMLEITRNILPSGIASTQVHFASRPKGSVYANRQALSAALRPQRNYQRQLVTLSGTYIQSTIAAGLTDTAFSAVSLTPGDTIVRARLRLSNLSDSTGVFVNAVDQTSTLSGPWSTGPIVLDISAVATVDAFSRMYVQLHNNGAGAQANLNYQLLVDVLR